MPGIGRALDLPERTARYKLTVSWRGHVVLSDLTGGLTGSASVTAEGGGALPAGASRVYSGRHRSPAGGADRALAIYPVNRRTPAEGSASRPGSSRAAAHGRSTVHFSTSYWGPRKKKDTFIAQNGTFSQLKGHSCFYALQAQQVFKQG